MNSFFEYLLFLKAGFFILNSYFVVDRPPSIIKFCPVIQLLFLSSKYIIILLISFGSPILFSACIFSLAFRAIEFSVMLRARGVLVSPGETVFTLIFFLEYVLAADLDRPSIPAFAEQINS